MKVFILGLIGSILLNTQVVLADKVVFDKCMFKGKTEKVCYRISNKK